MLQQKDNRSSGLKNLFSGSELSKFFKNLSQNPDVATKRSLCTLSLRLPEMSSPGAACLLGIDKETLSNFVKILGAGPNAKHMERKSNKFLDH